MPSDEPLRYDIIDTPAKLDRLAGALRGESIIGVDLEADSMYHFQEKVCLLQIAGGERNAIVDTLAVRDLSALRPIFRDADTCKVFHGADYDVRSLYRDFEIRVHNLFDTQAACRFLGYEETGLEAVLRNVFGIIVDKKYQRKDWSRRPLPEEMLAYAACDVRHLAPLARKLTADLETAGRLPWVDEECRLLSKVRPAANSDQPLFLSFKGAGRLDPRSLAVLEQLLALRVRVARDKDRPLFKVFNPNTLLQLAQEKPETLNALVEGDALSPNQVNQHGHAILAAIRAGLELPAAQLPRYPFRKQKMVPASVSDRIQALRTWRDAAARRLKLDPALVCPKATMLAVAERRPAKMEDLADVEELRQWQRKAFGRDMITVLGKPKSGS
jgi:ribonuclease D